MLMLTPNAAIACRWDVVMVVIRDIRVAVASAAASVAAGVFLGVSASVSTSVAPGNRVVCYVTSLKIV